MQNAYNALSQQLNAQEQGGVDDGASDFPNYDGNGEACTSYIMDVVARPIQVEVVRVVSFGWWDWERDKIVTMLDNVYTLEINVTVDGETSLQVAHYGQLENGTLSWFTDCGEPLE